MSKRPTPIRFFPKNPQKYVGNSREIISRSSWETKFMVWADSNPAVTKWNSEEIIIPYFSHVDMKNHRYFPDFLIEVINRKGEVKKYLIEVKPKAQTLPPKKASKVTKRYITEMATYSVNQSKWAAAEAWCKNQGISFLILTEDDLKV